MDTYSNPMSRDSAQAVGVKSKVSVTPKGNGPVNGKVASTAPNLGNGQTPGSSVKGLSSNGVKGGFVKV